jgi:hypothetical protein
MTFTVLFLKTNDPTVFRARVSFIRIFFLPAFMCRRELRTYRLNSRELIAPYYALPRRMQGNNLGARHASNVFGQRGSRHKVSNHCMGNTQFSTVVDSYQ